MRVPLRTGRVVCAVACGGVRGIGQTVGCEGDVRGRWADEESHWGFVGLRLRGDLY